MSAHTPRPVDIRLHRASRTLEVGFDDGQRYTMPCEYLRVYSPSAEVRGHGPGQETLQTGKEAVNIDAIEQVGNYAVKLCFDDGHDSGIYSWDVLYTLGRDYDTLWPQYLERLARAGHERHESHGPHEPGATS